jgi:hypothetical protein
MRCQEAREQLVHALYGELSEAEEAALQEHLGVCGECRDELRALKATVKALDAWREVPLPARQPSLASALQAGMAGRWNAVFSSLAPVALGMTLSLVSLFLLREYLSANEFSSFTSVVLGLSMGVLFSGLCQLAFKGKEIPIRWKRGEVRLSLKATAWMAITAIGMVCVLADVFPVPWVLQRMAFTLGPRGLAEASFWRGGYFLLGAGYTAIAFLPGGLFAGRRLQGEWLLHILVAACLYLIAIAPGLAVICLPFSLGIYLSMLGGSVVGSMAGAAFGFWMAARI